MIKVIETNYNSQSNYFQSRVIEVDSWEYIIDIFLQDEVIDWKDFDSLDEGYYYGLIRPLKSHIYDLKYDNNKLSCKVELYNKTIIHKFIEIMK